MRKGTFCEAVPRVIPEKRRAGRSYRFPQITGLPQRQKKNGPPGKGEPHRASAARQLIFPILSYSASAFSAHSAKPASL